MKDQQSKSTASSTRAGSSSNTAFGFGASIGSSFGSASSAISYLAEQPDLSSLTDPNVAVHFKNLSKKDGTTKSKALDDLIAYVTAQNQEQAPLEDGFLEAWVKVFPRLSIDVSRRVRQSSFALQKAVAKTIGKRIAKHMPFLAPAWLAGLHDGDRAVMRAAHDGLQSMFGSPEKQKNLRKAYQPQILAFGSDLIENETKDSLSDPKSTLPEDAEGVYNRVASSGIQSISEMLHILGPEEADVHQKDYVSLCSSEKMLALLAHGDSSARRAIFGFIKVCFIQLRAGIMQHITQIARHLTSKRTIRNQTGTSHLFVESLTLVINNESSIMALEKSAETLQSICKHGSQIGSSQFWANLSQLFDALPDDALPRQSVEAEGIVEAIKSGIKRKDEPRANHTSAWRCYFKALNRLCENIAPLERDLLIKSNGFALVREYVRLGSDSMLDGLSRDEALQILTEALKSEPMQNVAGEEWHNMTQLLLQDLQTSLPAQSKDFEKSQREVQNQGTRLFGLQGRVSDVHISTQLCETFTSSTVIILKEGVDVLESREGKPFGAVGCILAALDNGNMTGMSSETAVSEIIDARLMKIIPQFLFAPAGPQLIDVLFLCSSRQTFQAVWYSALEVALGRPDSLEKRDIILRLLTNSKAPSEQGNVSHNTDLQHYLTQVVLSALESGTDNRVLDQAISPHNQHGLSNGALFEVADHFAKKLSLDETPTPSLEALRRLTRRNPHCVREFLKSEEGTSLMQTLLRIQMDDAGEESIICMELLSVFDDGTSDKASNVSQTQLDKILTKALYEIQDDSLTVDTCVQIAQRQITATPSSATLETVLPNVERWSVALDPFISVAPPQSFAVTNELGPLVPLVKTSSTSSTALKPPPVDEYGLTSLLRIGMYTAELLRLNDNIELDSLERTTLASIFRLLALTVALADDRLSFHGANPLWDNAAADAEVLDFVTEARAALQQMISIKYEGAKLLENLAQRSYDESASSFYHRREWARMQTQAIEVAGWNGKNTSSLEERLKIYQNRQGSIQDLASLITAFQVPLAKTPALLRVLNETIAKLTSLNLQKQEEEVHQRLALLTIILHADSAALEQVAKQRLIFFVKHVVSWLISHAPDSLKSELCTCLTFVLPCMSDVYGEDWEKVLDFLTNYWNGGKPLNATAAGTATISLWHSSLKLFALLRDLQKEAETNEDLKDAYNEKEDGLAVGLANLLSQSGRLSDEANLPLRATNQVLARQIKAVPAAKLGDLRGLYNLLDTQSREVQQTAFDILHRHMPQEQEEISVNVAIGKSVARLPEELLSLVSQPPDLDAGEDLAVYDAMPSDIFTYLSSWLLVFDHFRKASYKVQSDYATHIREQAVLESLLDLIFATLGHAQSKPIDASKFDATFYSFNIETNTKRNFEWLLIHLYYLCLSRLPSLTKRWWIDCRSRQIRTHVAPWTEKYFSPIIIADTLRATADWAKQQDADAEDAIIVKTNERTKEVIASKEVDDQQLTIAIRLPSNFPLGQVSVEGINRVAVEEKKFKSWLLNTQGVIAFSDNSIADGLIAFRRNSGQTTAHEEVQNVS
ncbi:MAG: hypothetical protein Q9159_003226 [Coniocarpon cinnabarinum]